MKTSKSPLRFFLLVFALCVPAWVIGAVTGWQLSPGLPVSSLVSFFPAIAASILVYSENGSAGVKNLLKRSFDYKRIKAKIWYVPIVLWWPFVMTLEYGLLRLMGSAIPVPQFPILAPLVMFLIFFVTSLGEELGWMGYAIEPMQERLGAFNASVLLGLVWATWHIVMLVQAQQPLKYIVWQLLAYLPERILFVWLYNNTGKSVFAMAVHHAMLNVTWQLFPVNGSFYDPRITALIVAVAALIVIVVWGPKTLTQYRYARPDIDVQLSITN
jgi:membrane protease YdiL (CAAX protease family)